MGRADLVRVAVIDSGVHPAHPHIAADRLMPGILFVDGEPRAGAGATLDRIGHGTAVTAAIQEKAPRALIVPVRVFETALKTSAPTLAAAIAWSVAAGAAIVNLSLGTTNPAHVARFAEAVAAAVEAGVLIVAPRRVDDLECLPGALDGVLGVELDWECPRDRYRVADGVVRASGYPRPIDGVAPTRNLHGVSFATAQVSGFAARLLGDLREAGRDERELLTALLTDQG